MYRFGEKTKIFIAGEGGYKYEMGEVKEELWDVGFELEIPAVLDIQEKDLLSKRKGKKGISVKKEARISTRLFVPTNLLINL